MACGGAHICKILKHNTKRRVPSTPHLDLVDVAHASGRLHGCHGGLDQPRAAAKGVVHLAHDARVRGEEEGELAMVVVVVVGGEMGEWSL